MRNNKKETTNSENSLGRLISKIEGLALYLSDIDVEQLKKIGESLESMSKSVNETSDLVELSTLYPGETFKIGEHDFIVLNQEEGRTKVISKGFMKENVKFDEESRDYNISNLKKVIENDIQPIIENAVGCENVVEHSVDLTSVDMQSEFCSLTCKVRPITFDEAREFNDLIANKELDDWWWTCTPWSTEERGYKYSLAVVHPSGDIGSGGYGGDYGVRPFCILKSNIFVSKGE